jgi:signal transduction histidine kinase
MIHSLRTKLGASHVLPVLLLMPVLSLYLLYSLESFYTQSLLRQLTYQANLVQNRVEGEPAVMDDSADAQAFLVQIGGLTDARVLLLSNDRTILGSTRTGDADRIGTRLEGAAVARALNGENVDGIGPGFEADVAYVMVPIRHEGANIGALRLSYEVTDVRAQFNQLQWLILGGVVLTAALALGLSLAFATTITRPLHELSENVRRIAAGNYKVRVPANGRDEVATLARGFNEMAARLGEMEQMRQRQLAAITHELARPLTGMRAAADTLREDGDADPDTREMLLDGIGEEMERLQRLIEALQTVQKHSLRPLQLNCGSVSLERLVRAAAASYDALAAKMHINLSVKLPPELPPVRADEDRVIQVLTNLLDNAFKFTPNGGSVMIEGGEDARQVWVSVSDTGIGIAAEELPNLFQAFYHGGSSQPPEKHGMGLGLAISHEIIQAHRGRIRVRSTPAKGARFTFTLPKT